MSLFRNPRADSATPLLPEEEYIEHVQSEREYDREAFDRIQYAKQLLRMLQVSRRVAICIGQDRLRVEQGGLPGFPAKQPWTILSIPPDASRAHIALTVAQIAHRARDPFLLDLMLRVRAS